MKKKKIGFLLILGLLVILIAACDKTDKVVNNTSAQVAIVNKTNNIAAINETPKNIDEVASNITYCTQLMIGAGHRKIIDVDGRRLYVRINKINDDKTINVEVTGWRKDMVFGETTTLTFTKVYLVEMFDEFLSEPNVVKVYAGPEGCVVVNETEELDLKFLNTTIEEAKMCSEDSDCMMIKANGGCSSGVISINKNYEEYWQYEQAATPACAVVLSSQISSFQTPKCVNNRCQLANETNIHKEIQKILTAGDTATVDVGGVQAVVNLISVDLNNNSTMISVNGETKQMFVNETATFGTIKIYAKQIFTYTVPSRQGAVEMFISKK